MRPPNHRKMGSRSGPISSQTMMVNAFRLLLLSFGRRLLLLWEMVVAFPLNEEQVVMERTRGLIGITSRAHAMSILSCKKADRSIEINKKSHELS